MKTPPSGLTDRQRRIWEAAARIQGDDPTMPVGINSIRCALSMGTKTIRREIDAMLAIAAWPFPLPVRGGPHATAVCDGRPLAVDRAAREAADRMAVLQERQDRATRYVGEDAPGSFVGSRGLSAVDACRGYLREWKRRA